MLARWSDTVENKQLGALPAMHALLSSRVKSSWWIMYILAACSCRCMPVPPAFVLPRSLACLPPFLLLTAILPFLTSPGRKQYDAKGKLVNRPEPKKAAPAPAAAPSGEAAAMSTS